MYRRITIAAVAAITTLTLTACGGSEGNTSTTAATTATPTAERQDSAPEPTITQDTGYRGYGETPDAVSCVGGNFVKSGVNERGDTIMPDGSIVNTNECWAWYGDWKDDPNTPDPYASASSSVDPGQLFDEIYESEIRNSPDLTEEDKNEILNGYFSE